MKQKNLTFILYINKKIENFQKWFDSFLLIDPSLVDIFVYLDNTDAKTSEIIFTLFKSAKRDNITIFKNSANLGASFCFNNAINLAKSKYLYFLDTSITLEPNFFCEINKIIEENNNFDVVSFNTNINHFYNFSQSYTKIKGDQILAIHNDSIFNKIFSVSFLKKHHIKFDNNHWYPDLFLLIVLLNFKKWLHLNKKIVINNPENLFNFNIYDLLFQITEMQEILSNEKIYNHYPFEFEFWFLIIAKIDFINKISFNYVIYDDKGENLNTKTKNVLKIANQSSDNVISNFVGNYNKNPYYKQFLKNYNETNEE